MAAVRIGRGTRPESKWYDSSCVGFELPPRKRLVARGSMTRVYTAIEGTGTTFPTQSYVQVYTTDTPKVEYYRRLSGDSRFKWVEVSWPEIVGANNERDVYTWTMRYGDQLGFDAMRKYLQGQAYHLNSTLNGYYEYTPFWEWISDLGNTKYGLPPLSPAILQVWSEWAMDWDILNAIPDVNAGTFRRIDGHVLVVDPGIMREDLYYVD